VSPLGLRFVIPDVATTSQADPEEYPMPTTKPKPEAPAGARLQLALNVTDLAAATRVYSALFGTAPHKERPGYVNFSIAEPPLKLVLFENPGAASPLNHLGVELASTVDVEAAATRFAESGLPHTVASEDRCCHAVQDKLWVDVPDAPLGAWEFYTVLDDEPGTTDGASTSTCCGGTDAAEACTDPAAVAGTCCDAPAGA
jgi:catechol 2,3-dioxygenase-like lactoylglutathione lyase family enzyme